MRAVDRRRLPDSSINPLIYNQNARAAVKVSCAPKAAGRIRNAKEPS